MAFLCFYLPSLAQSHDKIRSGRPGQSINSYVVGTGYLQIESGIDIAFSDAGADTTTKQ